MKLLTEEVAMHMQAHHTLNSIDALNLGHLRPEICHTGAKGI